MWRRITPPMQRNSDSHQQEQRNAGTTILPTQNTFITLEMQEKQEKQHSGQEGSKGAADQLNHTRNETFIVQQVQNNSSKYVTPIQQVTDKNRNKDSGFDLSLPHPKTPKFVDVILVLLLKLLEVWMGGVRR